MRPVPFIALRYLFAKKSHNVINVISAISAAGITIGTTALILILSVCNGFNSIIEKNLSDLDSDISVSLRSGERFDPESLGLADIPAPSGELQVFHILEEDVFINYGTRQGVARAKGVDSCFATHSPLADHIVTGSFYLYRHERPMASVGHTLASGMGINPRFLDPLELYYPSEGRHNPLAGPGMSLNGTRTGVSSVFSIDENADARLIIVPITAMERLLGCPGKVSSVEMNLPDKEVKRYIKTLKAALGDEFAVLDRYERNSHVYKMMRYEKFAVYLILLFVVIIIAFNISGSMSMLIIEKKDDMQMLRAMGARDRTVRHIFVLEGWMISLLGMVSGMLCGIVLALLQQHFGFVKMPVGAAASAYPVVLQAADVIFTALGVAFTGLVISLCSNKKNF